jgi:hypothetical protein
MSWNEAVYCEASYRDELEHMDIFTAGPVCSPCSPAMSASEPLWVTSGKDHPECLRTPSVPARRHQDPSATGVATVEVIRKRRASVPDLLSGRGFMASSSVATRRWLVS